VNFAAITLCVVSQRVFIVLSVYFFIYSVRKLWDTPSNAEHAFHQERLEVLMVVKMHLVFFWVLAPCSVVSGHQRFKPEDEGSTVLRNVGNQPPHNTKHQLCKP
jgi:hypothetical protein